MLNVFTCMQAPLSEAGYNFILSVLSVCQQKILKDYRSKIDATRYEFVLR